MTTTKTTNLDQGMVKHAMSLYLRTGDGFVMHMNNGTTICRDCVKKDSVRVFGSLSEWSREDKDAACFPDLFTKETAAGKCARCNKKLTFHTPPPPLSLAVARMNPHVYTAAINNGVRTISILPN